MSSIVLNTNIYGTNSVDEKNALQREINELAQLQLNIGENTKVSASPRWDQILKSFDALGGDVTPDTLAELDTMIDNVNRMHSSVAAKYTYFQTKFDQLEEEKIAFSKSKSHFEDADFAEESTAFAREQLRQQTAGAMYSQANAQAQFALSLLP